MEYVQYLDEFSNCSFISYYSFINKLTGIFFLLAFIGKFNYGLAGLINSIFYVFNNMLYFMDECLDANVVRMDGGDCGVDVIEVSVEDHVAHL